jgi:hypothetical protein
MSNFTRELKAVTKKVLKWGTVGALFGAGYGVAVMRKKTK